MSDCIFYSCWCIKLITDNSKCQMYQYFSYNSPEIMQHHDCVLWLFVHLHHEFCHMHLYRLNQPPCKPWMFSDRCCWMNYVIQNHQKCEPHKCIGCKIIGGVHPERNRIICDHWFAFKSHYQNRFYHKGLKSRGQNCNYSFDVKI